MDVERMIEDLKKSCWGNSAHVVDDERRKAAEMIQELRTELEQMASCIYYKQGGLCRYGEEDPANVCVFGPCPNQRSEQEILDEKDAAVKDLENLMADTDDPVCGFCAKADGEEPCKGAKGTCTPKWRGRGKDGVT